MTPRPKYARPEIERRWLVDPDRVQAASRGEVVHIRDRYLRGTRLRLRRIRRTGGEVEYKLCKKYGDSDANAESIVNVYLSADEHAMLDALPGWVVDKERGRCGGGSLDRYAAGSETLLVYEREFDDLERAAGWPGPDFAIREITGDPAFSGLALARRFGRLVD